MSSFLLLIFRKIALIRSLKSKYISDRKELWHICKLIFVLFHGQSFAERGLSVNRKLMDSNMNEKSLISQRIKLEIMI